MLLTMRDGSRVTVTQPTQGVTVAIPAQTVTVSEGRGSGGVPYEGEYEVTPLAFVEQTLMTNGRVMRGDVTVHEVPYHETSNVAGGVTVSIAS